MKRSRPLFATPGVALVILFLGLGASALARSGETTDATEPTVAEARAAIIAGYEVWGAARVAYDREAMEGMLTEDFKVFLYGREISGEQFVSDVSETQPDRRLTRFDAAVLTVQKSDDGWTVVITEKLEIESEGADGEKSVVTSLWITRDGWRLEEGEWKVTSSEAIGHQYWMPGTPPPFPDWEK